jgi:hypothetical protein
MKFKLPRPVINQEICRIVSREARKQEICILRANKNNLKEIAEVSRAIVKNGLSENLLRKKLPDKLGYGIFLHPKAKPILKGQIIAPYAGEVSLVPQNLDDGSLYAFEPLSNILLTKEEQSHFHNNLRYHPRRFYSMHVDALKKGNFTRFINHSDKPNLLAELFRIPSNPYGLAPSPIEVIYLAKKTIRPGEQLLVCYDGDDNSYWGALKTKPIPITPKTFQLDSSLKVVGSINILT